MSRSRKVITDFIFVSVAAVLIYCGIEIITIQKDYEKDQIVYEDMEDYVDVPNEENGSDAQKATGGIYFW